MARPKGATKSVQFRVKGLDKGRCTMPQRPLPAILALSYTLWVALYPSNLCCWSTRWAGRWKYLSDNEVFTPRKKE